MVEPAVLRLQPPVLAVEPVVGAAALRRLQPPVLAVEPVEPVALRRQRQQVRKGGNHEYSGIYMRANVYDVRPHCAPGVALRAQQERQPNAF